MKYSKKNNPFSSCLTTAGPCLQLLRVVDHVLDHTHHASRLLVLVVRLELWLFSARLQQRSVEVCFVAILWFWLRRSTRKSISAILEPNFGFIPHHQFCLLKIAHLESQFIPKIAK